MDEDTLQQTTDKIFRVKSSYAMKKKSPGDCLVIFNSRMVKYRILQMNYEKRLIIGGGNIIILKEITLRLLKKRSNYKTLTDVLKTNKIAYRWEFPEGVSFTYKGKKQRCRSIEKFWRKYKKELGKKKPDAIRGQGEGETASTGKDEDSQEEDKQQDTIDYKIFK